MTESNKKPEKVQLAAIADDLRLLVRFHDRELDVEFLTGLRTEKTASLFSVSVDSDVAKNAIENLDEALGKLPPVLSDTLLDMLASEYANIYLCHNYRIAPTGSVWLTEEKLERQEPMFAVRDWYDKYGISAPDWRIRPDDHIAHELQFLAILCETNTDESLADAVAFLDECMLTWIPDFTRTISERAQEPIYIFSALLTSAYLEELRDLLETITGISRPIEEEIDTPKSRKNRITLFDIDVDRPFVPGVGESW